ncbi:hypothetical protein M5D96_010606 [Drosophila gunungcola]|uniref:Cation efflux protein transmembrane domain-containing protein n=1 Tax=Drosophila gunungcola TaxID=103775 RepID=A0A9P9YH05_9MUSC|nr:hypothetical protein M5D96_010606 [Drosophila gunungcola]
MPVKEILQRCRPIPLYTVLVLSICYFVLQLILSHLTHGLTLLMASHHMLCNIFALGGCIITIKTQTKVNVNGNGSGVVVNLAETEAQKRAKRECREQKLRNTFGWARIDILTMLIVFIILASLSFSLVVEALQTLVHIDHQDTMHLPIPMMMLGFVGLVLNGLTYLLIGGYTLHQGSFLHLTPGGNVVLERPMSSNLDLSLTPMQRQLSKSRNDRHLREELEAEVGSVYFATKRQGAVEMLRDVSSTIFVIVCVRNRLLKESCLILLQTIPGSIDLEIFERTLVIKFPEIISYHDLHIWQLAAHRYVATIHIQFQNPKLYLKIIEQVRAYFHDQGIGAVTIQPEFYPSTNKNASASLECLMQCQAAECIEKVCCRDSRTDLREVCDAPGGRKSSTPTKCQGDGHDHGMGKSKSCAELSAVVVEKPKELNAAQLLKGQDQEVAKSMPKLQHTPSDAESTCLGTSKSNDSPPPRTSSD